MGVSGASSFTGNDGSGGGSGAQEFVDEGPDPAVALAGSIEFSVPSGTFEGELLVGLSSAIQGEIHYTVDGQAPSASSPVYPGPMVISATTQIRAQVFNGSQSVGDPGTAVYVARSFDVSLDLPIVVLDNYGAGPLSESGGGFGNDDQGREFVDAAFMSYGLVNGVSSLAAQPQVATRAAFHIRGQSTASFPKTPYRLELRTNSDGDADWPLLGMPRESDWALRGPYADKSLIRDAFFYSLGRDMGMDAPRFAFAEFYLNTADRPLTEEDYMGVYLVVETLKNSKNRLDLAQLREDDFSLPELTGGYIFKFEWRAAEEPIIACTSTTNCWQDLEVYDPLPLMPEQQSWLTQHIQEFHDALHSTNWTDPLLGYAPLINVESFVDQLIVNELGRELDSYVRSAYFYKDRSGLITAGPLWDYNLAFDVGGFFGNREIAGWQYVENCQNRTPIASDWFLRLMEDSAFEARVVARWRELRQGLLSDAQLNARVSDLAAPLANAAQRNFRRWPNLPDTQVDMFETPGTNTWEEQIQVLRDWMTARVVWLDSQW